MKRRSFLAPIVGASYVDYRHAGMDAHLPYIPTGFNRAAERMAILRALGAPTRFIASRYRITAIHANIVLRRRRHTLTAEEHATWAAKSTLTRPMRAVIAYAEGIAFR